MQSSSMKIIKKMEWTRHHSGKQNPLGQKEDDTSSKGQ